MISIHSKHYTLHLLTAALLLTATSCHSKKAVTQSAKDSLDIEASSSISTSTAERFQWMGNLNIEMDSFELVMPIENDVRHFADFSNMYGDSALATPLGRSFSAGTAGTGHAAQPRSRSVVLRARRASIGKSDIVERNDSRCAQQADTMSTHRTMDRAEHQDSDTVAVGKPPDLTWLTWAIIAGLVFVFIVLIWLQDHER